MQFAKTEMVENSGFTDGLKLKKYDEKDFQYELD